MKKPKAKARKPTALQALTDVRDKLFAQKARLKEWRNKCMDSQDYKRAFDYEQRMHGIYDALDIVDFKIEEIQ